MPEYLEIDTASGKIKLLEENDFPLEGYYNSISKSWLEGYYEPVEARF